MKTRHTVLIRNAAKMTPIASNSIDLILTSPPYPMIAMWDPFFCARSKRAGQALENQDGQKAFEYMHRFLDPVWKECFRVLKPGGFALINIGDAVRTIGSHFSLFSNHARVLTALLQEGFVALPAIIWRKQTNAPNKFMGSGMLPAGAYVTLEHEYILILRKGGNRRFSDPAEKENRRGSAVFWEERNQFFSDVWFDIKGARQEIGDKKMRSRSAAFPFELAYRLINMYSVKHDTVLDPFLGMGTTLAAAMTAGRNSIGCEIDKAFLPVVLKMADQIIALSRDVIHDRLMRHLAFVKEREAAGKPLLYQNRFYGFPVVTRQETELLLNDAQKIETIGPKTIQVTYSGLPQADFSKIAPTDIGSAGSPARNKKNLQMELF